MKFRKPLENSVPITALVFLVIFFLKSAVFAEGGVNGGDFLWHIEYGNYMLERQALPTSDWLTWTSSGQPYQITQWLGELLIAAAFSAGGYQATALIVATNVCITFFFSWKTASVYLKNPMTSLLLALFATQQVIVLNARPQMFGIAAFAALVWVLVVWFEQQKHWALVAMSVIMVAWVNLHGSFIVGLIYIAALGGGAWLGTFAAMKGRFVDSIKTHQWLAVASFGAIFAALLNPYGWHAFEYVFKISQLESTKMSIIAEWVPTSIATANGQMFFFVLLATVVSIALAKERPNLQFMFGFIGTVYFGLAADRQTFFASIAMVPFLARSFKGSALDDFLNKSMSTVTSPISALVVVVSGIVLSCSIHFISQDFIKSKVLELYPIGAINFIRSNNIEGKIFNNIDIGGYIESQGMKPFIDGRLDLFGDEMTFGTFAAIRGEPGWEKFLDKYHPSIFLLKHKHQLKELLLLKGGYSLIYQDNYYCVIKLN